MNIDEPTNIDPGTTTAGQVRHIFVPALLLVSILLVAALSGCAARQEQHTSGNTKPWIPGCYSNLYDNEEGGDLLGYEFFIVYARDNDYLLYEESEGEPDVPLLLPIDVKGASISFVLPARDPRYTKFQGTITKEALIGRFENTEGEDIVLERKPSYWQ